MNFLNRVQNPTQKLQSCFMEYTMKLSRFLAMGLRAGLVVEAEVAIVELPADLLALEKRVEFIEFNINYVGCQK
jgi:hypothetical protein